MPQSPSENMNIIPDPLAVEIFMRAAAKAIYKIDKLPLEQRTTKGILVCIDEEIQREKVLVSLQGLDPGRETLEIRLFFGNVLRDLQESEERESLQG